MYSCALRVMVTNAITYVLKNKEVSFRQQRRLYNMQRSSQELKLHKDCAVH
jgi:hypothetical protein